MSGRGKDRTGSPAGPIARLGSHPVVSRFLSHYGMGIVLVGLCGYFSWSTIAEQHLVGAEAAEALAADLAGSAGHPPRVLIASGGGEEDRLFADTLERLLAEKGGFLTRTVRGGPAKLRRALEEAGDGFDVIAVLRTHVPIIEGFEGRFPWIGEAEVATPPSYSWPTFLLADNLLNVANQIAVIAIIAVGMTMVIITGGIDLSVGSLVAFSAVMAAWLIRWAGGEGASTLAMIGCSLGAVILCAAVGGFSGTMVAVFKLPPFIATLAMMLVVRGFAYIVSNGQPIHDLPEGFVWLGRRAMPVLGLPYAVALMIVLYLTAHVIMSRTTLGRYIYAVGGNPEAARLSGVRVGLILLIVYLACGAMAGLGGIVLASQLKAGAPNYGLMYELYVIACVVVGGTSLSGGEGKMMGTLIGAFIIAVIQNGMNLTNVESYTQMVVLGLVILGGVLLDRLRRAGWR